ncbi:hypothetical protein EOPP23_02320 [Endozoicomonas sp. OPT23]|uniref:hypothetical protein n=1 Tax=Endozoicomonas sp. OPT23 TaxID=2072845 RepID=UPI00129AFB15|nr:hypothetical protein [Endozoicomonas sp. OPT23]MRI31830.1 hypothetical protein [Endozoicomonas sp. OPT23]
MSGIDRASAGQVQNPQVIDQNKKIGLFKKLIGKFSGRKVQQQNQQNKLNDGRQLSKTAPQAKPVSAFKVEVAPARTQINQPPQNSLDEVVKTASVSNPRQKVPQEGLTRVLEQAGIDRPLTMDAFKDTDGIELPELPVEQTSLPSEADSLPLSEDILTEIENKETLQSQQVESNDSSVDQPEGELVVTSEVELDENNNLINKNVAKETQKLPERPGQKAAVHEPPELKEKTSTVYREVRSDSEIEPEVMNPDGEGLLYHEEFLDLLAGGDIQECCDYLEQSYNDMKSLKLAWNALSDMDLSELNVDMGMAKGMFDLTALNLLARDLDNTLTDRVLGSSSSPEQFKAKLDVLLSNPQKLDSAINRDFHSRSQAGSRAESWFQGANLNTLRTKLAPLVQQKLSEVREEYEDYYEALKG